MKARATEWSFAGNAATHVVSVRASTLGKQTESFSITKHGINTLVELRFDRESMQELHRLIGVALNHEPSRPRKDARNDSA